MLSEYMPFTFKYFYHIVIAAVGFVLFNKFVEWLIARNGTREFALASADDESTDLGESNVIYTHTHTQTQLLITFTSF